MYIGSIQLLLKQKAPVALAPLADVADADAPNRRDLENPPYRLTKPKR